MQVVLLVIDSGGIGQARDAGDYGDIGSNTIAHTATAVGGLSLPFLGSMGLAHLVAIDGTPRNSLRGWAAVVNPKANGKDTLAGHWEMMGITIKDPFQVFPQGFPQDVVEDLVKAFGRPLLGNEVASGTEIMSRLGAEHMATGYPIVYTSADSVLQIAAHEAVVPIDQLYGWCEKARAIMTGPRLMGRIIARPFEGVPGEFRRTANRRDFTVVPPAETMVDRLDQNGVETIAIGKIGDIFSGQGFSRWIHTESNADGLDKTWQAMQEPIAQPRFIFTNLVEFDSHYGHRRDALGYAQALRELDQWLPRLSSALGPDDQLWITADHGCDPTFHGTDHTRERVPWLAIGPQVFPGIGQERETLADIAATLSDIFSVPAVGHGHAVAALDIPHKGA